MMCFYRKSVFVPLSAVLLVMLVSCVAPALDKKQTKALLGEHDKCSVVELLAALDAESVRQVGEILLSSDKELVRFTIAVIRMTNDKRFSDTLFMLATKPGGAHREAALSALLDTSEILARKYSATYCANPMTSLADKLAFVELGAGIHSKKSLLLLASLLERSEGQVKGAALSALKAVTGADAGAGGKEWSDWIEVKLKPDLGAYLVRELVENRKNRDRLAGECTDLAKRYLAVVRSDILRRNTVEYLKPYLKDPSRDVQVAVLERIRTLALKPLGGDVAALVKSKSVEVRRAALMTLTALAGKEYEALAVRVLVKDASTSVRVEAARYLGLCKSSGARAALISAALNDEDARVRAASLLGLAENKWPETTRLSLQGLKSENASVREAAAVALGKMKDPSAVEPLVDVLSDKNSRVRYAAADSLGQIGSAKALDALVAKLSDEETSVAQAAVDALGRIGDERAISPLQKLVGSSDTALARQAWQTILALCSKKPSRLLALAEALAGQKNTEKSREALEWLEKLAGPEAASPDFKLIIKVGQVYLSLGMRERGLKLIRISALSDSADAQIWMAYTETLEKAGKEGDLWSAYNVALGRFPQSAEIWWKGKLRLVGRLIDSGRNEQAVKFLEEIKSGNSSPIPGFVKLQLEKLEGRIAKPATKPGNK